TADAVGQALFLAKLGVQPRGELPAKDLVDDQRVGVIGVEACNPRMTDSNDRLRGTGSVKNDDSERVGPLWTRDRGECSVPVRPAGKPLVERFGNLIDIDVARYDTRRAPRTLELLVEAVEVRERVLLNNGLVTVDRKPVGMVVAKESTQQGAVSAG